MQAIFFPLDSMLNSVFMCVFWLENVFSKWYNFPQNSILENLHSIKEEI